MLEYPLGDGIGSIELIDFMGNDLSIVNDARTSYNRQSSELEEKDIKLINYLIKHQHTCYDDQTEVLAKIEGEIQFILWKDLINLKDTKEVELAAYDKDSDLIAFEKPTNYTCNDHIGAMYSLEHTQISLLTTINHNMLVSIKDQEKVNYLRRNNLPCSKDLVWQDFELIEAEKLLNKRAVRYKKSAISIIGHTPNYPSHLNTKNDYVFGQLVGFFLGDGYSGGTLRNAFSFHLKKQRKIDYLYNIAKALGLKSKEHRHKSFYIYLAQAKDYFCQFYDQDKNKIMPSWILSSNFDFRKGVLDGLKNSDGSIKRTTWTYSTTSKKLAEQIQILGSFTDTAFSLRCDKNNYMYHLNANSRSDSPRVNDGIIKNDKLIDYKGKVYCATVSTGVLVVRRNNKIVFSGNSPLRGVTFKFKVKAPLYTCRQWWKHVIASNHNDEQLSWNEQCISKDQKIKGWWGKTFTMQQLYELSKKGKLPFLRSMAPDGSIVKGKIKSVWSTGVNKVYKVKSKLGFEVVTTMNHRFATPDGFAQLKELKVGDVVMMNGVPCYQSKKWLEENYINKDMLIQELADEVGCSSHTIRAWLRKHDLHLTRKEVSDRSIRRHGVFGKGETKDTNQIIALRGKKTGDSQRGKQKGNKGDLHHAWKGDKATINAGHYRARKVLNKDKCVYCESTNNLEIHHIDGNPLNNDVNNLEALCQKHHQMRHQKQVLLAAHPVKIESIEYVGEEETYDLEMELNHNFVANQFIVHNSLRYVSLEGRPEYYIPKKFRKQSKDNKQGSFGVVDAHKLILINEAYKYSCNKAFEAYEYLLKEGVCREQARGVLPTCIYTSWVWTTSLQAVLHFINLREHKGSQWEIQQYANAIKQFIKPIVPEAIKAWEANYGKKNG